MIGLREDQRERAQLVGKINALFPELRDAFVASGSVVVGGLVVASGLATTGPPTTTGGLLQVLHQASAAPSIFWRRLNGRISVQVSSM